MPFAEQVSDNRGLLLPPVQMTTHRAHEFCLVPSLTNNDRLPFFYQIPIIEKIKNTVMASLKVID